MVVDTVQDVGEVGLRVKAQQFDGLDDGHRVGQGLAAGIGAREHPVLAPDDHWLNRSFRHIVVDCHPAIINEWCEGRPSGERVAHRLGEIALAENAGEPGAQSIMQCIHAGTALALPHAEANIHRAAVDPALDIIECADPFKRLPRHLGAGGFPDIMEGSSKKRPAGGIANPGNSIGARPVERREPGIGVGLQNALEAGEIGTRVLALAIRQEKIGDGRLSRT